MILDPPVFGESGDYLEPPLSHSTLGCAREGVFQGDIQHIKANIPVTWFHNLEVTQDKAKEPRGLAMRLVLP